MDPARQRSRLALLAWLRVGFGALSGLIAGVLQFVTTTPETVNSNAYYGIYIAVIVYIASYYLARNVLVKGIATKDRNKLFTQGIGSFIMMFLFVWIMYNTYNYCILYHSCFI